jgi:hypothetical protein
MKTSPSGLLRNFPEQSLSGVFNSFVRNPVADRQVVFDRRTTALGVLAENRKNL